jgi:acyl-CoA reductase-like NAD-dependent aldehyde dehydrogenase
MSLGAAAAGLESAVEAAVSCARTAQVEWAGAGVGLRLRIVRSLREQVAERAEELAAAGASEGHCIEEVLLAEVLPLLEACRFLERRAGELLKTVSHGMRGRPLWLPGVQSVQSREPLGVVAVVSPGNYPLFLGAVSVVQALVVGNAVVWKPAPGGGRVAGLLSKMFSEAGLPADVLQVLPEEAECGRLLVGAAVDKVVFTGGHANGVDVASRLARNLVPAVLELSGCDAVFVRSDADLPLVAKALRFGLTFNESRTCLAPRRVFVARSVAGELERLLKDCLAASRRVISCNGWSGARVGALRAVLDDALGGGARFLHGGLGASGEIQLPCVLADARPGMRLFAEDVFAPVLGIMAVDSDAEALEHAARCGFALGASVFSRDAAAAARLAAGVRCGLVSVNDLIVPSADPRIAFGGTGSSGYGVTRGAEGLLELTRIKVVQTRRGGGIAHLGESGPGVAMVSALARMLYGRGLGGRFRAFCEVVRKGLSARSGGT